MLPATTASLPSLAQWSTMSSANSGGYTCDCLITGRPRRRPLPRSFMRHTCVFFPQESVGHPHFLACPRLRTSPDIRPPPGGGCNRESIRGIIRPAQTQDKIGSGHQFVRLGNARRSDNVVSTSRADMLHEITPVKCRLQVCEQLAPHRILDDTRQPCTTIGNDVGRKTRPYLTTADSVVNICALGSWIEPCCPEHIQSCMATPSDRKGA